LPPYGACLLSSINLARLVRAPFTPEAHLDEAELADLVAVAIRMMDNTIDTSGFPLEAQRQEAIAKRRIGLGMTGLADALMMTGLRYGSLEAAERAGDWARQISRAAYLASAHLAREKGAFPLFDREAYLAGKTVGGLDADVRALIAEHGIRNALLTSVAPTGTISLVADNVSSGVEPVFALAYTRKVLQPDGSRAEEEVSDYALRRFRAIHGDDAPLPEYFVTAQDLAPAEHVRMQAAVQRHVDSAISKTVNVPEDIGFEAFQAVYLEAYRSGCKGCTTYRPNAITGAVLEVKAADATTPMAPATGDLLVRSEKLSGATYKLRWPDSEHAMYVTLNDIEQDGIVRPFEIFVNSKNLEHYAWVVALTRMISAVFRRGGNVTFVAEELKQVFDPRGGQWSNGRYVGSLVAAIGDIIERHMVEIGFLVPAETLVAKTVGQASAGTAATRLGPLCPKCGQPGLVHEAGCLSCVHCGWSKCN
jgi:ribonucleoside-diphosphate reductase alpha chain